MRNNTKAQHTAEDHFATLTAIAAALGPKDPYTQDHAQRVAIYARRLAVKIGMNPAEVERIRLGGLLHDVGKIGLSEKILTNTNQRLPENMLAAVHQHPQIGVALLKGLNFPLPVIDLVLCHHEKMDGSGYPLGLKSNQIPLGAKIIRVADCFDAITTDRPYQRRKSWIAALAILRQISGSDLDPELVQAFILDVKEKGMAFDPTRCLSLYRTESLSKRKTMLFK